MSRMSNSQRAPVIVEEKTEILYGHRHGIVTQVRAENCTVLWQEHVEKETGEVVGAKAGTLTHDDIQRADVEGRFKIVRRPDARSTVSEEMALVNRTSKEIHRLHWRHSYVLAAEKMIRSGLLEDTRASFIKNFDEIQMRGNSEYLIWQKEQFGKGRTRGGASLPTDGTMRELPTSGATFFDWHRQKQRCGLRGLFDNYARSGRRGDRYSEAERELTRSAITARLDQERPSIMNVMESVQATFTVANMQAEQQNPPAPLLRTPGYDYIRDQIDAIAPMDHAIRTKGMKRAYRDMHGLGMGVQTTRAMERVEIDEYTVDLMVLLTRTGLYDFMSDDDCGRLVLDNAPRRVTMSAAIDVHTRCIVAMKIGTDSTRHLFRETAEMIFMDKGDISDAVGAHEPWKMCGRPEEIVLDRGSTYIADESYDLLAELGICNIGAPAEKPWLRPFIERLFRTIHESLLSRFSGRTFSNVVMRGDNNAAERASVTLAEFLSWLTRWIVDIYHTTPHAGLDKLRPIQAWDLAVAQVAPRQASRQEMRHVFGVKNQRRKIGPKGLRVMNVYYQSDELMRHYHRVREHHVEFRWWPGDIGAIEVSIGRGRWITVPAADPFWIEKTFDDLQELVAVDSRQDDDYDRIRHKAIYELDQAALQRMALRRLLPKDMDEEEFERKEAKFNRHMVTAERLLQVPESEDLFAEEVQPIPTMETMVVDMPLRDDESAANDAEDDLDDLME